VPKKPQCVLLAFLFLSSAAWPGENTGHWVTLPAEGQLVILGVSNRRLTREGEIESARDDAARKLLFYHGITGKTRTAVSVSTGPNGMRSNTETTLEPIAPAAYGVFRESLRFDPKKMLCAMMARFLYVLPARRRGQRICTMNPRLW
jgi:hypothetical protein